MVDFFAFGLVCGGFSFPTNISCFCLVYRTWCCSVSRAVTFCMICAVVLTGVTVEVSHERVFFQRVCGGRG